MVDLFYPRGHSINDGIEAELCSVKYTSVDKRRQKILELGVRTRLAKLEGTYWTVPVHPDDRWSLGMMWKWGMFIYTVLPFGSSKMLMYVE